MERKLSHKGIFAIQFEVQDTFFQLVLGDPPRTGDGAEVSPVAAGYRGQSLASKDILTDPIFATPPQLHAKLEHDPAARGVIFPPPKIRWLLLEQLGQPILVFCLFWLTLQPALRRRVSLQEGAVGFRARIYSRSRTSFNFRAPAGGISLKPRYRPCWPNAAPLWGSRHSCVESHASSSSATVRPLGMRSRGYRNH